MSGWGQDGNWGTIQHNYMKRKASVDANKRSAKKLNPDVKREVDAEVGRQLNRIKNRTTNWRVTDYVSLNQVVATAGTTIDIQGNLARGDLDFNNFEGNQIFPKWLEVRWRLLGDANGVIPNTFRLMIGQQIKASGVPLANQVCQISTNGAAAIAPWSNDYHEAFKVLHDELIDVQQYDQASASNSTSKSGKIFINGSRLRKIDFVAATVVPLTGGLFVWYACNDTPPNNALMSIVSRIKFSC